MTERSIISIVLLAVTTFSACTSLEDVSRYAKTSHATLDTLDPIGKDFYHSCTRSNSYKPIESYSQCKSEKELSTAIVAVTTVLDNYMQAMAALTADTVSNYTDQFKESAQGIKDLKLKEFDDKKVDAVGKIASWTASMATQHYQRKTVKDTIQNNNGVIVETVNGLADVLAKHYTKAITSELDAWQQNYRNAESKTRESKPMEWDIYAKEQWTYRGELEEKLALSSKLAQSLRLIGSTHQQLNQQAETLTSAKVYEAVQNFIQTVAPVIKDTREAFSK